MDTSLPCYIRNQMTATATFIPLAFITSMPLDTSSTAKLYIRDTHLRYLNQVSLSSNSLPLILNKAPGLAPDPEASCAPSSTHTTASLDHTMWIIKPGIHSPDLLPTLDVPSLGYSTPLLNTGEK